MKTKCLSLLALLMIFFASTDANASTLPSPTEILNEIHQIEDGDGGFFKFKFRYVRGRRNEAGICHDRGMCDLEIGFEMLAGNSGGLTGELRKDRYENVLLIIDKGGVTTDEAIDITGFATGPGILHLSNDSNIPAEGKTELSLPSNYQLKAGSYQVTETATTYIVNFGK